RAVRYFEEAAHVRWKIVRDFPDYHYPKAPGSARTGRYLEVELFDGAQLGDWQKRTYLSPHVPFGITHDELFAWGGFPNLAAWDFGLLGRRLQKDQRGFGPGMMAYFVKAMMDRGIPAHIESAVRELVVEGGAVIGVRAEHKGRSLRLRARRGVVLACG